MVPRKWHMWAALLAVIFFCLSPSAQAKVVQRIKINLSRNQIAMIFISLTDGEATLIKGNHKNILINTGDSDSRAELNNQLDKMGVNTIDTLIITNLDSSYTGNVKDVVKHYDVSKIFTSDKIKREFCEEDKNLCYLFDVLGDKGFYPLPNLNVRVYEESESGDMNIFISYGHNSVYYMGFSNTKAQDRLIKENPFNAAIIKLSNYGNGFDLSQDFLKTLDPEMAVLFHKSGVEPNEDLLNRLSTEWVETYILHHIGTLTFVMTPDSYEVGPFFE